MRQASGGASRLAAPDEAILMHLSNFRPVKRVVDVVKVFAHVVREMPAQLILVGDGPDRSAAEWLAHDLDIQDKVHFLGKLERVNETAAAGRYDGDAKRAGVVRPGCAGGDGVQGSLNRHARWRSAGADRRRGHGPSLRGRRSGGNGCRAH